MAWTYFSPELTLKEMELVENKDDKYMRSFKMLNNADVNETEMKESSSSSKYVSAYCRRKTIEILSQDFPDANQKSNSYLYSYYVSVWIQVRKYTGVCRGCMCVCACMHGCMYVCMHAWNCA